MQKLLLAATLLIALGAMAISGSLVAAHQKNTATVTTMDPAALTLKANDLPVVQVNEPF
jgi:hypothetical protein